MKKHENQDKNENTTKRKKLTRFFALVSLIVCICLQYLPGKLQFMERHLITQWFAQEAIASDDNSQSNDTKNSEQGEEVLPEQKPAAHKSDQGTTDAKGDEKHARPGAADHGADHGAAQSPDQGTDHGKDHSSDKHTDPAGQKASNSPSKEKDNKHGEAHEVDQKGEAAHSDSPDLEHELSQNSNLGTSKGSGLIWFGVVTAVLLTIVFLMT